MGICRWLIGLLERLVKHCIYIADPDTLPQVPVTSSPGRTIYDSDPLKLPGSKSYDMVLLQLTQPLAGAILLFLFHPFASRSLHEAVGHVKRFHNELNTLSPTQENSQIAKDVFMDTIDSSGINIDALVTALDEHKSAVKPPGTL